MGRKAISEYRVKQATVPNAGKTWYIIGRPNGKRTRAWFHSKQAAQAEANERNDHMKRFGEISATLSGVLANMALECETRLKRYDKTLHDATEFYCDWLEKANTSISVEKLCSRLLVEYQHRLDRKEVSASHVARYKEVIAKFQSQFGQQLIFTVKATDIYNWINSLAINAGTKKSYRQYISGIFRHAQQTGLIKENPVAEVAFFPQAKRQPVPILSVSEAEALLRNAAPEILPYLALGLFGGPRRSEINRLGWKDVDFQAGLNDLSTEKTKTSFPRWLKISDNLRAWLLPLARESGPIVPPLRAREYFEEARTKAGIESWPNNGLRHSFVSYHLAMHEDLGLTSLQAGHANPSITKKHYFRRVRQAEAIKYWAIFPS